MQVERTVCRRQGIGGGKLCVRDQKVEKKIQSMSFKFSYSISIYGGKSGALNKNIKYLEACEKKLELIVIGYPLQRRKSALCAKAGKLTVVIGSKH